MAEDDDWLSNLLWTDEAQFTLRGSVNTHNCRIWATENPRTVVETPLHDEKVTVAVMIVCSAATFIMLGLPGPQDLIPCDYWLFGLLKSQVYRDRPTSLGMLKDNIRLQCLSITPDMLYSAVHNIYSRLQLLLRNDGEHIEHFL
ncbi:uncharacterized protein TNCV_3904711 [Trichonephila clavipes]|nr:uncharacterized protein TNCV_3904711 [Trichonephila clavipes]